MSKHDWIARSAAALFSLTGLCGTAVAADLLVAMPNWPSGQAAANIIKYGIQQKLGLEVEVREMGTMMAFAGMDIGEVDAYPEVWMPNFDSLVKKYVEGKKTVRLSPKRRRGDARHLRHPRDRGQVRHQGHFRPDRPGKGRRLRYRRRRQGRNVDRLADLVVDEHRDHPRQELRLCRDDDAAHHAGGCGDGGRRRRRRHRAADRVLLLQPAPCFRAPRPRYPHRTGARPGQVEDRAADRRRDNGWRNPRRRWLGTRRGSTSALRLRRPSACPRWRRSCPASTSRPRRSRR